MRNGLISMQKNAVGRKRKFGLFSRTSDIRSSNNENPDLQNKNTRPPCVPSSVHCKIIRMYIRRPWTICDIEGRSCKIIRTSPEIKRHQTSAQVQLPVLVLLHLLGTEVLQYCPLLAAYPYCFPGVRCQPSARCPASVRINVLPCVGMALPDSSRWTKHVCVGSI
jgi:hypothetical protein